MTPYIRPHLMFGSVTRQNVCQPLAPRLSAASSSSDPTASMTGMSSRATNGNVTNAVASTSPGSAKMIFRLWFFGQIPKCCWTNSRAANTTTLPTIATGHA
jgi:hypothetical protein